MKNTKIVYWPEEGAWLGYLQEFAEYWPQFFMHGACRDRS